MAKMPNDYDNIEDRKLFSQLLMLKFVYPDDKKWVSKYISELKVLIEVYEKNISLKHLLFSLYKLS